MVEPEEVSLAWTSTGLIRSSCIIVVYRHVYGRVNSLIGTIWEQQSEGIVN